MKIYEKPIADIKTIVNSNDIAGLTDWLNSAGLENDANITVHEYSVVS